MYSLVGANPMRAYPTMYDPPRPTTDDPLRPRIRMKTPETSPPTRNPMLERLDTQEASASVNVMSLKINRRLFCHKEIFYKIFHTLYHYTVLI